MTQPLRVIMVRYTNWKGETRVRPIVPIGLHYGSTQWHPEPQWLLTAENQEDGVVKSFALKDCDFRIEPNT